MGDAEVLSYTKARQQYDGAKGELDQALDIAATMIEALQRDWFKIDPTTMLSAIPIYPDSSASTPVFFPENWPEASRLHGILARCIEAWLALNRAHRALSPVERQTFGLVR
jgi:hypothetical protein